VLARDTRDLGVVQCTHLPGSKRQVQRSLSAKKKYKSKRKNVTTSLSAQTEKNLTHVSLSVFLARAYLSTFTG
jgi:hypothetical protein